MIRCDLCDSPALSRVSGGRYRAQPRRRSGVHRDGYLCAEHVDQQQDAGVRWARIVPADRTPMETT